MAAVANVTVFVAFFANAASDVSAAKWVTVEELPELQLTPKAEQVIRKALAAGEQLRS